MALVEVEQLRERTSEKARRLIMARVPCVLRGHTWETYEEDNRLDRCPRCLMVRIKRYRNAPKKALRRVRDIVGKQQLCHPGPLSNAHVTAIVWITDEVSWKRIAQPWSQYHLSVVLMDHGLVSAGAFSDVRYDKTIAAAVRSVHEEPEVFFENVARSLRGEWWQPSWWWGR